MKISVITACYNSASTIEEAMGSMRRQLKSSDLEIEYIIVDGQSKDNTLEVVERYRDIVTHIVCEKDTGIYDALNKGIRAATGDVIGFLHSDDSFACEDALQIIASTFRESGCDAVYGNGVYVSKETGKVIRKWESGEFRQQRLNKGWMPMHPTFYVKRDVYLRYGLFNDTYRIAADYDIVLRFLKQHAIRAKYINKDIISMKVGGASSSVKNYIKKWKEDFTIMKSHGLNPYFALIYKNLSKIGQFFHSQ
ncbi:glycosyltransferase family 2 protein [Chitinophaga deserti]|uniref:glycosyltransferase family 2 protein n=1 Tax=Chitinophaga deserti TaxID=2164099 RepID=UPI000D6CE687|nr:glycosyltransferase family 2 protein [Chitinophaga deserti]